MPVLSTAIISTLSRGASSHYWKPLRKSPTVQSAPVVHVMTSRTTAMRRRT
jgi:hypothetical protein